jgi:ABC-type molybdate transport system substrate-binding protein
VTLNVLAAASLTECIEELKALYTQKINFDMVVSFASQAIFSSKSNKVHLATYSFQQAKSR